MKTKTIRLEVVRRRLEQLTASVEHDLQDEGVELARSKPDQVDRAQDLAQVELAAQVSQLLDRNRAELEHAMERARRGGYGACEDCGRPIQAERLRFMPEATRCVSCARRNSNPIHSPF